MTQGNRSLQDRSWDLLAELWLNKEAMGIMKELQADKEGNNTADMDAFFAQYDAKNLELIKRYTRKQKSRHFLRKTLPRVTQAAAVIITVVVLAGGVAVAASNTARVYLMKLLVEVTPEYTSLQLVEDRNDYVDVPADWQGEYYPTIIPEGLEVSDVFYSGVGMHEVIYSKSDEYVWQFTFSESSTGTTNIDTEDARITPVMVCGYDGTMVIEEDRICIYWYDGITLFQMDVRGHTEKEALLFANSVRKIK